MWHERPEFQSTHPRGVRQQLQTLELKSSNFNPRTHVGCDEVYEALLGWLREFQSTHPRGVRPQVITSSRRYLGFQSTHPRGVRLWSSSPAPSISNFNPRTHVGCDLATAGEHWRHGGFQSTHPRGVRHNDWYRDSRIQQISIHAPTWGATIRN